MSGNRMRSWVRVLKPYNNKLIVLGFLLDAVVVAWVYMDDQFSPVIYAALTFIFKFANVAVHYINGKLIKEVGDDEADTAAG